MLKSADIHVPVFSFCVSKTCSTDSLGSLFFFCSFPGVVQLFVFRLSKAQDVDFTQCATHGSFSQHWQETVYNMFHFTTLYVCPLVVMVWCYSCILLHIHHQATAQRGTTHTRPRLLMWV